MALKKCKIMHHRLLNIIFINFLYIIYFFIWYSFFNNKPNTSISLNILISYIISVPILSLLINIFLKIKLRTYKFSFSSMFWNIFLGCIIFTTIAIFSFKNKIKLENSDSIFGLYLAIYDFIGLIFLTVVVFLLLFLISEKILKRIDKE